MRIRSWSILALTLLALSQLSCATMGLTPLPETMPAARAGLQPEYRIFYDALQDCGDWTLIEPFGNEKTAIIPQGLLAEITIRLGAHIQRMVPGHVERQSLDGGRVAQVVQLLQEQNANDDVQILRRATELFPKVGDGLIRRL